jgi:hypothetical protein
LTGATSLTRFLNLNYKLKFILVKRQPPQQVDWARPNWRHAASGIRCRADWKNAHVYDTKVGWIIAYSQAHANDRAAEVLLDEEIRSEKLDMDAQLWAINE